MKINHLPRKALRAADIRSRFIVGKASAREYAFLSELQSRVMQAFPPDSIGYGQARENLWRGLAYYSTPPELRPRDVHPGDFGR